MADDVGFPVGGVAAVEADAVGVVDVVADFIVGVRDGLAEDGFRIPFPRA